MKNWITHPKVEGNASRQAHCDLPEGTYERELGKEGFFGPASHMYHANPPTGWTNFDGPLRPRAFDTTRLEAPSGSPWDAAELMHNAHTRIRSWQSPGGMDHLVRNSDGDELLFIHAGAGELYCDYGRMEFREGDYIMLPRGTMWRLASDDALDVLMIEATNSSYMLPDKGLLGPHAIFDPAMLDTPSIDEKFKAQQGPTQWDVVVKRRNHGRSRMNCGSSGKLVSCDGCGSRRAPNRRCPTTRATCRARCTRSSGRSTGRTCITSRLMT